MQLYNSLFLCSKNYRIHEFETNSNIKSKMRGEKAGRNNCWREVVKNRHWTKLRIGIWWKIADKRTMTQEVLHTARIQYVCYLYCILQSVNETINIHEPITRHVHCTVCKSTRTMFWYYNYKYCTRTYAVQYISEQFAYSFCSTVHRLVNEVMNERDRRRLHLTWLPYTVQRTQYETTGETFL